MCVRGSRHDLHTRQTRAPYVRTERDGLRRFLDQFSANWIGSGRAYHPHLFQIISDRDDDLVGPAGTHLTASFEVVGGQALLALQDSKNVDVNCILRNDDTVVGCGGTFDRYKFTENRSIASCNGLIGELQSRDCFPVGNGTWYSFAKLVVARSVH